jgi:hypothetical protein
MAPVPGQANFDREIIDLEESYRLSVGRGRGILSRRPDSPEPGPSVEGPTRHLSGRGRHIQQLLERFPQPGASTGGMASQLLASAPPARDGLRSSTAWQRNRDQEGSGLGPYYHFSPFQ